MTMRRNKTAAVLLAMMALMTAGGCATKTSDPAYCGVAQTGYKNDLADVNLRMSQYSACISRSTGSAACSAEFSALRSSQSNLEASASDVRQYCKVSP
jgi:hypothetical protein